MNRLRFAWIIRRRVVREWVFATSHPQVIHKSFSLPIKFRYVNDVAIENKVKSLQIQKEVVLRHGFDSLKNT
jgi:hypothetical protein